MTTQRERRSRNISVTLVLSVDVDGGVAREDVVDSLVAYAQRAEIHRTDGHVSVERAHEAQGGSVRREG